jgi:hypothetical protein
MGGDCALRGDPKIACRQYQGEKSRKRIIKPGCFFVDI